MDQKRLYKQLIIEIGLASLNEIKLVDECSNSIYETKKLRTKILNYFSYKNATNKIHISHQD